MRAFRICLGCLLLLIGCNGRPTRVPDAETASSALTFEDVANPWKDDIVYHTGEEAGLLAILESLGGGVGVIDFDGDSSPDLLFPAGGRLAEESVQGLPSRLLRGEGNKCVAVSAAANIDVPGHYSHGCAIGDFANDGFPDALITGYGGLTLWRNQGDGTFTEISRDSGLDDSSWSSSAGWGDLNGDGILDLYVAHYVNWTLKNNPRCVSSGNRPDVCPPRQFDPLDDVVYFGVGDGSFTNESKRAGLIAGGKGLGVLLFDADNDADLDIYVANDTTNNFLYLNDGHGRLQEQGVLSGVALDDQANANGSMGVAATDYDKDGIVDLWVTNYEDEVFALYHGADHATFTHVSASVGIQRLGQLFVGFGCISADLDHDGYEDFVVANGHVIRVPRNAPVLQQPLLLRNVNGQTFERSRVSSGYFAKSWSGRGLASLDADDDGKLDLVFVNSQQPAALVRNSMQTSGRSLQFRLIGRQSNRDAIGARVRLVTSNAKKEYIRWVYGGGSYLSSSSRVVHFGLPKGEEVLAVEIIWPGGVTTRLPSNTFRSQLKDHRINVVVEPHAVSVGKMEPGIMVQDLPRRN